MSLPGVAVGQDRSIEASSNPLEEPQGRPMAIYGVLTFQMRFDDLQGDHNRGRSSVLHRHDWTIPIAPFLILLL
jgi:hypothetical protein